MIRLTLVVIALCTTSGCVPLMAGAITHNALERNADSKERYETHRHQERMRELDIQEKYLKRQAPTYPTYGGIVREVPF